MPKKLIAAPKWKPDESVARNARMELTMMVSEYFVAGRKIVAAKPGPSDLHPFRLATKRLRYTLEVFREVYGPTMEKKLKELKPVQDALGAINDCMATNSAFGSDKKLRDYLDHRAHRKAGDFYRLWTKEFDAPGNRERWIDYLARVRHAKSSKTQPAVYGDGLAGQEIRTRQ